MNIYLVNLVFLISLPRRGGNRFSYFGQIMLNGIGFAVIGYFFNIVIHFIDFKNILFFSMIFDC